MWLPVAVSGTQGQTPGCGEVLEAAVGDSVSDSYQGLSGRETVYRVDMLWPDLFVGQTGVCAGDILRGLLSGGSRPWAFPGSQQARV